jgi:hypothetical protein
MNSRQEIKAFINGSIVEVVEPTFVVKATVHVLKGNLIRYLVGFISKKHRCFGKTSLSFINNSGKTVLSTNCMTIKSYQLVIEKKIFKLFFLPSTKKY